MAQYRHFGLFDLPLSHCHRPPLFSPRCPCLKRCYEPLKIHPPVRTGLWLTNNQFTWMEQWLKTDRWAEVLFVLPLAWAGLLNVRTPISWGLGGGRPTRHLSFRHLRTQSGHLDISSGNAVCNKKTRTVGSFIVWMSLICTLFSTHSWLSLGG